MTIQQQMKVGYDGALCHEFISYELQNIFEADCAIGYFGCFYFLEICIDWLTGENAINERSLSGAKSFDKAIAGDTALVEVAHQRREPSDVIEQITLALHSNRV